MADERTDLRIFSSFAKAEAADREFYRKMTMQERIDMTLALLAMTPPTIESAETEGTQGEPTQRLAGFYRKTQRAPR